MPGLTEMEFLKNMNGSLLKITKEESELLMDIIRTENPCQIEGIASLRHKQLQKLFTENLRISFYNSCVGQEVKLSYAIHAKNLPNPLFGELTIAVVE